MKSMQVHSQSLNIVTNPTCWQQERKTIINKRLAFVPTMGHLHAGHMALCKRAKEESDIVVASIFVNPQQFNDKKDYELYPRTVEEDFLLLQKYGVDYLFLPDVSNIYPDNYHVKVVEDEISEILEGAYRPGHFAGVLTVVLRLFNIIQPNCAYFGEKDYQQLLLIQKMISALFLPISIIACQTVRDKNGLALSSRNSRLSLEKRTHAAHFHRLLKSELSCGQIREALINLGFQVDYIVEKWQRRLGAVWLDDVRLIDNVPWHGRG